MAVATTVSGAEHNRIMWRMRLHSALRTVVAYSIIGSSTLYGPPWLRKLAAFPAFSYVTATLITSDSTLGETLSGSWHAILATVQTMPLSMLGVWIAANGSDRLSPVASALALALTSLLVALLECTHFRCKKIAFGQLVLVFADGVIRGVHTSVVVHPLRVAWSTVLGIVASLLALSLPYPKLAYFEVRKLHQLYAENSKERVDIYSRAIISQDNLNAVELLSRAKLHSQTGAKLFHSTKVLKGGLMWETPWLRFFKYCSDVPGDNELQNMEITIRGMEIALTSCPSFSTVLVTEELKGALQHMSEQICRKSEQTTHQETKVDLHNESPLIHNDTISPSQTSLPTFFFLSCAKMLLTNSSPSLLKNSKPNAEVHPKRLWHNIWMKRPRKETLAFAFKCSVSLGLAMWLGLLFDKENGFWAGLTVASSLAQGKIATFTIANAQAQGIAFGSVYGVLGCSIFKSIDNLKFLALLPWIIFSSFLKNSRIYGQSVGISALLGAVMILGRENYGPPNDFAIIRLTETFIGLSCFTMVQFLFNPKRAANLAKNQLHFTMDILKDCMNQIEQPEVLGLMEKQRKLKSHILDLQKKSHNAEVEPDFWFLPFNATCYKKLQGSLSKIADLFYFMIYNINSMSQDFQSCGVDNRKELQECINDELEHLKETTNSSLTFLDNKPSLIKLFPDDDQEEKRTNDLEEGKLPTYPKSSNLTKHNDSKGERGLSFFLERSKKVIDRILSSQEKEEQKGKLIVSLYALGFCISSMLKEIKDIKMAMKELSHWESP
ncbi:uncharacterized protein LOC107811427 [Nicotiana tabacum]|uniref:Uncharacterized protein LOC107811427 n=2 Tax=Nicotiana TaxID=4085 RepID=A0A1S4BSG3_TOBAC|nr:PREDICTED: uncharacterized protein LOC104235477 [Nicotiana sylvestris]XP_016491837.1 PREDICTED: uncharacterized protein LOC107811427 [Nicotiana tabacum]